MRQEQTRRLQARIDDGRKIWKLSPMDLKSYSRWHDYSRARDEMFKATDTPWAPWFVIRSDDKKRARLNAISHLLRQIPYEDVHAREGEAAEAATGITAIASRTIHTSLSRNLPGRPSNARDMSRCAQLPNARLATLAR